jgi:uncharacterized repeat protein (TIGR03803 family)
MITRLLMALFAALLLGWLVPNASAQARTENVLYAFQGGSDGAGPYGGVIFDAAGNLYGTTAAGGASPCDDGCGTVFELSPAAGGGWTETVIHTFGIGTDGIQPEGALVFDAAGNLYGTTLAGGTTGLGTVFELSPDGAGGWNEQVLYNFDNSHGSEPIGSLVMDVQGNLYGSAPAGGRESGGAVFELTPGENGAWTKRNLYNFRGGTDGRYPWGNLIFDSVGNLYGATDGGGEYEGGTVYELVPPISGGGWTKRTLHNFGKGKDGLQPAQGLVLDAAGNLYGATFIGGSEGNGTIFELVPGVSGTFTYRLLHSFSASRNGIGPEGDLILDSEGNLYGTTYEGGSSGCIRAGCGTAFRLSNITGGTWEETVWDLFSAHLDGGYPAAPLVFDSIGNLYGTTGGGSGIGAYYGAVFEITQ